MINKISAPCNFRAEIFLCSLISRSILQHERQYKSGEGKNCHHGKCICRAPVCADGLRCIHINDCNADDRSEHDNTERHGKLPDGIVDCRTVRNFFIVQFRHAYCHQGHECQTKTEHEDGEITHYEIW